MVRRAADNPSLKALQQLHLRLLAFTFALQSVVLLQGSAASMMLHSGSTRMLQQQHQAACQQRPLLPAPRRARSSKAVYVAATATAPAPAPAAAADLTKQIVADEAQYVLQTYARPADIVFVKGEGSKLYDTNGKEYLDMAAGALAGHCCDE
jgi:hypothetical protein